jgi:hypothetical protein
MYAATATIVVFSLHSLWYFIILLFLVFALAEGKNQKQ